LDTVIYTSISGDSGTPRLSIGPFWNFFNSNKILANGFYYLIIFARQLNFS